MSDTNLRHKHVSIEAKENTGSWVEIAPGSGVNKMVVRGTGAFRLADSSSPGANYMTVPSGVAHEHESGASLYGMMPKAGIFQILRYS